MMDKSIRLYQAITDIDDSIIEEAEKGITIPNKSSDKKRLSPLGIAGVVAAACVVVAAATVLILSALGTSKSEQIIDNPHPEERDYSPISYQSLELPEAQETAGLEGISEAGGSMDITTFNERNLQEISCCGILEGKILQIYPKEYAADFYDDKFGEVQLFHGKAYSIVYEMEIEKVWYGDGFAAGQTLLVEDEYFQLDPLALLMEGRTYVIPIYEAGDQIGEAVYSVHELAPGDFTRDSIYSTVYPYHPQITKTEDGNYLVTSDWQTLTADPCREVIADGDDFEPYYQDKLRLVYGDDFAERLSVLIQEQLGGE